jgi:hypothetical protein
LLSLGDAVESIEPTELREAVCEHARILVERLG